MIHRTESKMLKINPHKSLNPLIGYLIRKNGLMNYIMQDHPSEDLRKILNRLFKPVSDDYMAGVFIRENIEDSFCGIMKNNEKNTVIKFMASLMALALGVDMEYRHLKGFMEISSPTEIKFKLRGWKSGIQEVLDVVNYIKELEIEDIKTPVDRLMDPEHIILQAFLSQFLNSKEDFKFFVKTFIKIAGKNKDIMEKCFIFPESEEKIDYSIWLDENEHSIIRNFIICSYDANYQTFYFFNNTYIITTFLFPHLKTGM